MLDRRLVSVNRGVLDVNDVSIASASSYDYSGWHSGPVALHNTHQHDPVSWGTSLRWPDVHNPYTTISNTPSHQWQVFVTPPPGGTFPLHSAAEYHLPSETQPPDHPPTRHPFPPPHSHPSSPLLSCRWIHDDTLRICGFQGALDALKAHQKTHFNAGPSHQQVVCQWDGCEYKRRSNSTVRSMRRDCMWRHTCEIHLGMRRAT